MLETVYGRSIQGDLLSYSRAINCNDFLVFHTSTEPISPSIYAERPSWYSCIQIGVTCDFPSPWWFLYSTRESDLLLRFVLSGQAASKDLSIAVLKYLSIKYFSKFHTDNPKCNPLAMK